MVEHVKGYGKLTEEQKKELEETHQAHLSIMGSDMKKKHTVDHIKEVKWDARERCFKVFYDHGDWYHYEDCRWY